VNFAGAGEFAWVYVVERMGCLEGNNFVKEGLCMYRVFGIKEVLDIAHAGGYLATPDVTVRELMRRIFRLVEMGYDGVVIAGDDDKSILINEASDILRPENWLVFYWWLGGTVEEDAFAYEPVKWWEMPLEKFDKVRKFQFQ